MKKKEKKLEVVYALRHKKCGKLLRMYETSNEGRDFCNSTTVELEHYCNDEAEWHPDTWYVDSALNAEYVRQFSTEWYNSCQRTPKHYFKTEDLEVVEVNRVITTNPIEVKIPTLLEYTEAEYAEKDPGHYELVKREIEEGTNYAPYSLYELLMLVENGKWKPKEDSDVKSDKS